MAPGRLCHPALGGQSEYFFQGWAGWAGLCRSSVSLHRWSSPRRSCSRTHPTAGSVSCPFPELRRILGKCGAEGGDQAGTMLGTIFSSWRVLMGVHLSPMTITMAHCSLIEQMSVDVSQLCLHMSKWVHL